MKNSKLLIAVFTGLIFGQIFAETENPVSVINTLKFGYTDNLYRNANNEKSTFVEDTVDLAFRAALSSRTDFTLKSRLNVLDDKGGNNIYPNLYLLLDHTISPRLVVGLTEYYRSGDKSGSVSVGPLRQNRRYNYYENKVGAKADYILTQKDRLSATASYRILRHESVAKEYDSTTIGAGISWKRDIILQRTSMSLNLHHSKTDHDNSPVNNTTVFPFAIYNEHSSSEEQTDLSLGFSHTLNQDWLATITGGASYVQPDYPDYLNAFGPQKGNEDPYWAPLVKAGVVYSPSPRTRFNGDFLYIHSGDTGDNGYGSQQKTEFSFGAQREITAKIVAKATARFTTLKYSQGKNGYSTTIQDNTENLTTVDFKVSYRLNRIHFLETGYKYARKESDRYQDWTENRVHIGWRVEL